jgi:serine/threonine-protein kinase
VVGVPSLSGLTLDAASSAIVAAGLSVGRVTNQTNGTFPAGTVISQSPLSGEKLTAGQSVDLVVSAGQAQVTVPEVRGRSQADASADLVNAGLVVSVGQVFSTQPFGIVVTQGPVAGTSVVKGSTVTISVSKGPAPVRVPNVVGAQEGDADTSLQDVGLVPVSVPTSGTPSQVGIVISQSPEAGTRVRPGSQVRIHVGQ